MNWMIHLSSSLRNTVIVQWSWWWRKTFLKQAMRWNKALSSSKSGKLKLGSGADGGTQRVRSRLERSMGQGMIYRVVEQLLEWTVLKMREWEWEVGRWIITGRMWGNELSVRASSQKPRISNEGLFWARIMEDSH